MPKKNKMDEDLDLFSYPLPQYGSPAGWLMLLIIAIVSGALAHA